MAFLEIPLSNVDPAFTFTTDLDGETFNFEFRWNTRVQLWIFDLFDNLGDPIQLGNPFNTGNIFLRQNVSWRKPKGDLIAINNSDKPFEDANRFTLGGIVKLHYAEIGTELADDVDAEG